MGPSVVVEVFAEVTCPFAHVGLDRFVGERRRRGADHVRLWVRAWPLELINGEVQDGAAVAAKAADLRAQVAPHLFAGLDLDAWPSSTLPAMALAAAAHDRSPAIGEAVSLAVRRALFEEGRAVDDPAVLADIGAAHGVEPPGDAEARIEADWQRGRQLGVVGSPHFVVDGHSWFCPSLRIGHRGDHLDVEFDRSGFGAFVDDVFA